MKNVHYKIHNGDCMDYDFPKCRLLLADIPYDMTIKKESGLRKLNKDDANTMTFDLDKFLKKAYKAADIVLIFCGHGQFSEIYDFFKNKTGTLRQLVWAKTNPSPLNGKYIYLSGVENMIWFKKRGTGLMNWTGDKKVRTNVFNFPNGSSKIHPTEKNHKLLKELILNNTNEGDLVFDPCFGSASTGIVSLQNGRNFEGVEISKHYYEIGEKRLKNL